MNDDHDAHIQAHVEAQRMLMRAFETTKIRVRHAPGFWLNLWLTLRHGPKIITWDKYWAEGYAAMKSHVDRHGQIHLTAFTDEDLTRRRN